MHVASIGIDLGKTTFRLVATCCPAADHTFTPIT